MVILKTEGNMGTKRGGKPIYRRQETSPKAKAIKKAALSTRGSAKGEFLPSGIVKAVSRKFNASMKKSNPSGGFRREVAKAEKRKK